MNVTCLHTAQSHVATFDALFRSQGWGRAVNHVVRPDLLRAAQDRGLAAVSGQVEALLTALAPGHALLCTCSTLGPLIDALAPDGVPAVRIDRPMMQAAVVAGGRVMLVICLQSTQTPSVALLEDCATKVGAKLAVEVVFCADAWPCFEAGEMARFHGTIADEVRSALIERPDTDCVVLAQASMQGAGALLTDLAQPVLASPVLAVRHTIEMARRTPA